MSKYAFVHEYDGIMEARFVRAHFVADAAKQALGAALIDPNKDPLGHVAASRALDAAESLWLAFAACYDNETEEEGEP